MKLPDNIFRMDWGVLAIVCFLLSAFSAIQGALVIVASQTWNATLWGGIWVLAGAAGILSTFLSKTRMDELALFAQAGLMGWVAWTLRVPSFWAIGAVVAAVFCVLALRGTGE